MCGGGVPVSRRSGGLGRLNETPSSLSGWRRIQLDNEALFLAGPGNFYRCRHHAIDTSGFYAVIA